MGGHANYYWIIEHLIVLKGEFHRITKEKYQPVINELSTYEVFPHSDNEHVPDHKQLAVKLNYSQSKMNSLLRELLKEVVAELQYHPLQVKKHVHQFLIHIPWDVERDIPNKKYVEQARQQSVYLEIELPVTPRIGEEVTIPFLEEAGKFYSGYVHEVKHKLTGNTQEIMIFVHPWDDYYYQWVKMKDEYERRQRWKASMRNG
jgi:hypothetical protein